MTRHFLRDDDLSPGELTQVLDLADQLKTDPYRLRPLAGPKTVALIFDKQTLRTQLSFSVGISQLGGQPIVVDGRLAGIGERESIADVTRVLTRQADAIVWRTAGQDRIEEMASNSTVPVVNALTDDFHPCQILADLQTVRDRHGHLDGIRFSYVGDGGNNMAHSYLLGGAAAGMHVTIGAPEGYQPRADILADGARIAASTGGSIRVTAEPERAFADAQVLATDTWVSMGMEGQAEEREGPFVPFSVTAGSLRLAAPEAFVLHCLPAYRGKEIAAEVIDGPQSAVWDQAENRLHAQKALLAFLIGHRT